MASYPRKTKTTTAVESFSKLDLSSQHITTTDFFDLTVAKYMELVPKQSVNLKHVQFTRLEPLPVPTFGNADMHSRAYFVPYRTIFPAWNEFIDDTQFVSSDGTSYIPTTVPLIKNSEFVEFLLSRPCAYLITDEDVISNGNYDISHLPDSGAPEDYEYYNLTNFGRKAMKLIVSLGYKVNFVSAITGDSYHSALPLLALAKVYYDWYYPSAYTQDFLTSRVVKWFTYDMPDFSTKFGSEEIGQLIQYVMFVCYDSDYFTSAWDNPVAPNNDSYTDVEISDITADNPDSDARTGIRTDDNGTPYADLSVTGMLSQFMLNALRSVSDYMARHRIVGARVLDRYLSRWGIVLSSEKLKRSVYIDGFDDKIQFSDVTSTADTEGSELGAYAGFGYGRNECSYDFSTDEYGMFFVLSSIVPKTAYYQGQDRITMHQTRFDFFTPEFDNIGTQVVTKRELYVPLHGLKVFEDVPQPFDYDGAFGFVPRYAEYKKGNDIISGDYLLGSKNAGKDSWTLFRDVSSYCDTFDNGGYHDVEFVESGDRYQYNRIFYNTSPDADHFNVIHNFVIESKFPGKPLFDTYEFKNEDKGQKVSVDINGVKAN